ncbi:MAG TPA: polyprenol monophosphomannose synthase [Tepidisphaeraceae bacterium]
MSIVVPTLNEAGNLRELVERLDRTLGDRQYEILIVDDGSRDGTHDLCIELQRSYPLRLLIRSEPTDGLSGAVLHGLARAHGEFLVVMDADLQHAPEQVADLLVPLVNGTAEFVLGSRYVPGGTTEDDWGLLRRANSKVATLLARPFAGQTRDPMSGFFALHRQTYERAGTLNPIGYKVALELICKCRVRQVREVPIRFGLRGAGRSKLTLTQQVQYLDHLSRLYDYCFPRASTWAKFLIVTGCAWFVAFGLYVRLVARDVSPVFAPTLAFAGAALATALFHRRSLRTRGRPTASPRDWLDFALVTLGEWSICALAARWVAMHVLHLTVIQFFAVTFGVVAVGRYALRARLTRNLNGIRFEPDRAVTAAAEPAMRQAA